MDTATAARVVKLIAELRNVSGERVFATVVAARWTDAESIRLSRVVGFILDGDSERLQSFEWYARELGADLERPPAGGGL